MPMMAVRFDLASKSPESVGCRLLSDKRVSNMSFVELL